MPNVGHCTNVEKCPESFDSVKRSAKVGFRHVDIPSSNTSAEQQRQHATSNDGVRIQHWALVFYFEDSQDGPTVHVFEANCNNEDQLEVGRGITPNLDVFRQSTYLGTIPETSPRDLLIKARSSKCEGSYDVVSNNCQTWLKKFLDMYFPELLNSLYRKLPFTKSNRDE